MDTAVLPEGESVIVPSTVNSSGDAYHTRECDGVDQIASPKTIDVAVARWKDLEECDACRAIREGEA